MRTILAIWAAKITGLAITLARKGHGSTLPGRIALAIKPDFIAAFANKAQYGAILISGTNGKTTTAKLLAATLRGEGKNIIANTSSANLATGVASTLASAASLGGSIECDYFILELDEHAVPAIAEALTVKALVLTNLFRDQLDRAGEINKIVELWRPIIKKLPENAVVIANANDVRLVELAKTAPHRVYFGLDDALVYGKKNMLAADTVGCPDCSKSLQGDYFMAHLGVLQCPECGYTAAKPDVVLKSFVQKDVDSAGLTASVKGAHVSVETKLFGRYNALNVLAVLGAISALGGDIQKAAQTMATVQKVFGRSEVAKIDDTRVILHLAKNPTGYTEVLASISDLETRPQLSLLLNDNWADGQDISWIWDVDFERIAPQIKTLLLGGLRSGDLAIRLHMAGSPQPLIEPSTNKLLSRISRMHGTIHIIASYTAMLEMRNALVERGYLQRSWT